MNEMRPPRAKPRFADVSAIANRYDRVALVLQGGGALGAYQIGVYQRSRRPAASPIGFRAYPSARLIPRSSPQRAGKAATKP